MIDMTRRGFTLGVDFGTSNSAAGYLEDGRPRLIEMAPGRTTLPTTFFFDFASRRTLIGEPANLALLDGAEGRFMRALKRVLGGPLMHEERQILNEKVTFVDIIGRFLKEIKTRAEAQAGRRFDRALSGRPVVFHRSGDVREDQAEADLRACYHAAGFEEVAFMAEPEAAAIASGYADGAATNGAAGGDGRIGLIVDIGGGTSDFSLFRVHGEQIEILANHGVRIGGTDFDRSLSIDAVMPLLGKGTLLNRAMGRGATPAPNAIFNDLATWELIPFLYTAQNRRLAADMAAQAHEPDKLRRLTAVLEAELGHELAFAVEQGKIAANAEDEGAVVSLSPIEAGLSAPLAPRLVSESLAVHGAALRDGVRATLTAAGVAAEDVNDAIYVGGSSLMTLVPEAVKAELPKARHAFSEVFTAVADGLAIAAAR